MPGGCNIGLEGARVLVTASTRGIGFGIARAIAECGGTPTINGRSPGSVERALETLRSLGLNAYGVPADLAVRGEASRLVREAASLMGGLDGLVYVPPPPPSGGFREVSLDDWRLSYRLLIEAAVEAVREAINIMGRGSIVFVTSIAAIRPMHGIVTSSVLRPGLHVLTRMLARELGPRGIRVNAVAPGLIMTDRLRALAEERARAKGTSTASELESMAGSIPLGRLGTPRDIGSIVVFLLSTLSEYVSGAVIPVAGGMY